MQDEFAAREQALTEERRRREEADWPHAGAPRPRTVRRCPPTRGHPRRAQPTPTRSATTDGSRHRPTTGATGSTTPDRRHDPGRPTSTPRTSAGRPRADDTVRSDRPHPRPALGSTTPAGHGPTGDATRPGGGPDATVTTTEPSASARSSVSTAPLAAATDAPTPQSTSCPVRGRAGRGERRQVGRRPSPVHVAYGAGHRQARPEDEITSTPSGQRQHGGAPRSLSTVALPRSARRHGGSLQHGRAEALGAGTVPSGRRSAGTAAVTIRHA